MVKAEMYTTKDGERRFQVAAPVSEEDYEDLRRLAYEQRTTIAAQVRRAVAEYVGRNQPMLRSLSPVRPLVEVPMQLDGTPSAEQGDAGRRRSDDADD